MGRKTSAIVTRTVTDKYTLYTVPPRNRAMWELIYIASLTSNDSPTVYWYDSSLDIEYVILGGKNLGVGEYLLLNGATVVLEEGDQIRVKNSTTNTVTYIATVELEQKIAVTYHQN